MCPPCVTWTHNAVTFVLHAIQRTLCTKPVCVCVCVFEALTEVHKRPPLVVFLCAGCRPADWLAVGFLWCQAYSSCGLQTSTPALYMFSTRVLCVALKSRTALSYSTLKISRAVSVSAPWAALCLKDVDVSPLSECISSHPSICLHESNALKCHAASTFISLSLPLDFNSVFLNLLFSD